MRDDLAALKTLGLWRTINPVFTNSVDDSSNLQAGFAERAAFSNGAFNRYLSAFWPNCRQAIGLMNPIGKDCAACNKHSAEKSIIILNHLQSAFSIEFFCDPAREEPVFMNFKFQRHKNFFVETSKNRWIVLMYYLDFLRSLYGKRLWSSG